MRILSLISDAFGGHGGIAQGGTADARSLPAAVDTVREMLAHRLAETLCVQQA